MLTYSNLYRVYYKLKTSIFSQQFKVNMFTYFLSVYFNSSNLYSKFAICIKMTQYNIPVVLLQKI